MNELKKYDYVIVGNGSIGTLSAIELKKKYPKANIAIVGNKNRKNSASIAAGAMANVYAEIEKDPENDPIEKKYLKIGIESRKLWLKFFKENSFKNVITTKDTILFLKKNSSNFEQKNFKNVLIAGKKDKTIKILNKKQIEKYFKYSNINIIKAIKIINEFSICTVSLFNKLDQILKKYNISLINFDVKKIKTNKNNIEINLENGKKIFSNKVIVSAGSNSEKIFTKKLNILTMLQGVGTAIIINNLKNLPILFKKYVVRTVNRGGAQCGLHTVPRSDGTLYLGAGNYISNPQKSFHRLETIKYLYNLFENELVGKNIAYSLTGNLTIGYRPRSMDGFPMIGSHSKDKRIFFATATNRVGLTWAPKIAEEIIRWSQNKDISDLFKGWYPNRTPISFGSKKECINYYVESRISAALEHEMINLNEIPIKSKKFKQTANNLIKKLNKKFNLNNKIFLNPDNWQALNIK